MAKYENQSSKKCILDMMHQKEKANEPEERKRQVVAELIDLGSRPLLAQPLPKEPSGLRIALA